MTRKKKPSGQKRGRPRSIGEIRRQPGNRKPRKVILIICEGEKTEPLYFEALKRDLRISSVNIQIIPNQGAPISIVKRAKKEKTRLSAGDEVWCVFDVEEKFQNKTFPEAVLLAQKADIGLAVSNPAFEYWYLLHFECTDRSFTNANEIIKALYKYLPKYKKSLNIYEDIKDKTEIAIERASNLRAKMASPLGEKTFPNPSTHVDKLVAKILKLARQG